MSVFFWVAGIISGFAGVVYLSSILGGILSLLVLGIYSVIIAITSYTLRMLIGRKRPFHILLVRTALRFGSAMLLFFTLIGSFCFYQNEVDPAKLGIYPISNGDKVVEFHSMAHIASEKFYNDTRAWVQAKKAAGYTLFFEGVRPGTPENEAKFDALLGFSFTPDLYKQLSRLYGLREQDNREFLGFSGASDENVDVGIDDIIRLYEAKYTKLTLTGSFIQTGTVVQTGTLISTGNTLASEVNSMEKEIAEMVENIPPKQLEVIRYFNRATLNFLIKHKAFGLQDSEAISTPGLFDIILTERNKHLADAILSSSSKKIIVLYGDLHFDGVFNLLQEKDSKWKVSSDILWNEPMRP